MRLGGLYEDHILPLRANEVDLGSLSKPFRNVIARDLVGFGSLTVPTLSVTTLDVNAGTLDAVKIRNSSSSPWALQILNTTFSGAFGSAVRMFQDNDGTFRIFGPGGELLRLGNAATQDSVFLGSNVNINAGKLNVTQSSSATDNITMDTSHARGASMRVLSQGVVKGYVGTAGFYLGSTDLDLSLAANTGQGLKFFVNGSASPFWTVNTAGVLQGLTTTGVTISGLSICLQINGGSLDFAPNNNVQANRISGILFTGNPATNSGSANGDVVIGVNGRGLRSLNGLGTSTISLITAGASDQVIVGVSSIVSVGNVGFVGGGSAGDLINANSTRLMSVNNAGNANVIMLHTDSSDRVVLAGGGANIRLGTGGAVLVNTTVTSGASGGDLVLAHAAALRLVNNAGTTDIGFLSSDASDRIVLGNATSDILWNKANVALGGGAAATLGTIGGSGPAAAAQRAWIRFIETDGTASFWPCWR